MQKQEMEKIYNKYVNVVFRVCLYCTKDKYIAEDLTQEIFIKIFNKISGVKNEACTLSWIYRLAQNHCFDFLRKKNWRQPLFEKYTLNEARENYNTENSQSNISNKLTINKLLQNADEQINEIICLKFFYNYNNSAISRSLGLSKYRIKKILKDWLEEKKNLIM